MTPLTNNLTRSARVSTTPWCLLCQFLTYSFFFLIILHFSMKFISKKLKLFLKRRIPDSESLFIFVDTSHTKKYSIRLCLKLLHIKDKCFNILHITIFSASCGMRGPQKSAYEFLYANILKLVLILCNNDHLNFTY